MAVLTAEQAAEAAYIAGFRGNDLVIAVAVAGPGAESGWTTDAINRNPNGSTDYGVWQINSIHKGGLVPTSFYEGTTWQSPVVNAQAARKVWDAQGWRAWVAYKNGSYKANLPAAQAAVAKVNANPPKITVDGSGQTRYEMHWLGQALIGMVPGGGTIIDTVEDGTIDQGVENIGDALFGGLGKAMWIGGGVIAVLLGVVLLAKSQLKNVPLPGVAGIVKDVVT